MQGGIKPKERRQNKIKFKLKFQIDQFSEVLHCLFLDITQKINSLGNSLATQIM